MANITLHPFKEGVRNLLRKHFGEEIVKNFLLEFEINIYNPKEAINIWNQKKDNNLIMEVRYKTTPETSEYICDLYSWETKAQTEVKLLKYITDKFKTGQIGKDWTEKEGRISATVTTGKYETPKPA